jgi:NAD(P)-dependent dehydrogenase (short-subunit alcohol dehydrogenase family)
VKYIMDITFDNKVAVITGAASGIGLGCAEMLAAGGAKAALVDIDSKNLAEATKQVQRKGIAKDYQLDVRNPGEITSAVNRIRQDLGEVDILVCSAGIGPPRKAEDIDESEWDAVLSTNTKGVFFCNQAVATQSMMPRQSGSIVNIASVTGLVGTPPPLMSAHYHSSKAGVVGLTRAEAIEWASYNIRVNAIAPCAVSTPLLSSFFENQEFKDFVLGLIPLRRVATVGDVAAAVCFLASDFSNMITGVTLPVDGGLTAR